MRELLSAALACLLAASFAPAVSLGQEDGDPAAAPAPKSTAGAVKGLMKRKSPEERARLQAEAMQKDLGLDDGQKTKLQDINKKYANQVKSLRADTKRGRERSLKVRELAKQRNEEIKQVLTPEQYQKYEQNRDANRPSKKSHAGKKPAKQSES